MSTIIGILSVFALSHLGGMAGGGILARFGVLGFGKKLGIAKHVLAMGKALRAAVTANPADQQARDDLNDWLQANDPRNETGLGL